MLRNSSAYWCIPHAFEPERVSSGGRRFRCLCRDLSAAPFHAKWTTSNDGGSEVSWSRQQLNRLSQEKGRLYLEQTPQTGRLSPAEMLHMTGPKGCFSNNLMFDREWQWRVTRVANTESPGL
ncbi:hypothetical protein BaRGS_00000531 [Batillaria attramentaria]|uniref:Uncharacterized protein n=1 Tax=Batillaria attramentaria TaxID=370345 RepID=A0ABD0M976_9CAEN